MVRLHLRYFLLSLGGMLLSSGGYAQMFNLSEYCLPSSNDVAITINKLLENGDVFIPTGYWKLSSKICLPSGRMLKGEGRENTFLWAEEPLRMVEVRGNDNVVSDIYFKGTNSTDKASYLIFKVKGTKNLMVSDCTFEGATGGVFIDAVCDSIKILNCLFRNMYLVKTPSSYGYGIVMNHNDKTKDRGTFYGLIEGNVFEQTVFRHALYLQSSENIVVRNNIFYGSNEKKPTGYEYMVNLRGCRHLVFEGNYTYQGYGFINGVASEYHGKGADIIIENNIFEDNTLNPHGLGIINMKFHQMTVRGNTFRECNTLGIYVATANNGVIEKNVFEESRQESFPAISISKRRISSLKIKDNVFQMGNKAESITIDVSRSRFSKLEITGNDFNGDGIGIHFENNLILEYNSEKNTFKGRLEEARGNVVLHRK